MFEAFVIVCATTLSYGINQNSCFPLNDEWGPYKTEENCSIRANQMSEEILRGELNPYFFELYQSLGVPIDLLYAEGHCEKVEYEKNKPTT
jgi:hypothetical protein